MYQSKSATPEQEDFEKGRIRALQEERLHIQKKTFTKWMNSFLLKAKMEVEDLFTDLADGRKLLRLLEIISGEKLGKPNSGKMRVHRIENVNKSLAFLHTKVRLENIGAEDIVDGNPRMILGLIWTIILRFQIQEIEIDVDDDDTAGGKTTEKKSAKEALLLWCQRRTNGYQHVDIRDFSHSWQNGLGFNALIHHHRPDLINFARLDKDAHLDNLRNAFDIAEKHLGIPQLLDPEDIDVSKPDEKSVLTYIATYYHTFAKLKTGATGGKRIENIVRKIKAIEEQQESFETFSSSLLVWIRAKTVEMRGRDFSNTLDGIQIDFKQFKDYRTVEKPPKLKEKVEIEAAYFDIQIKLQQLRQAPYVPPEGQRPHDIEQSWKTLEKEEYGKEMAIKQELLRQEKLEQLAYKFERKSVLREGYLNEMIQVLSDPRYGSNLNQVGASVKKHEAISADILARKERFMDLKAMSAALKDDNYHAHGQIGEREEQIMTRWQQLLDLLKVHKDKLERYCTVINLQREIETLSIAIATLHTEFSSTDNGIHLLDVQEKLHKFQLQESQVNAMSETIRKVGKSVRGLLASKDLQDEQATVIQSKVADLEAQFSSLLSLTKQRQTALEDSHSFFQLIQDFEEEGQWCDDKLAISTASITAKDQRALTSLQQKHKALEDEMTRRHSRFVSGPLQTGQEMVAAGHPLAGQLEERIQAVMAKWASLREEAGRRRTTLESATDAYLFFSDCNETDSVIKESVTLAKSKDFGQDKLTAMSLLQRHKHLQDKIQSIQGDVGRVQENGQKLMNSQISQEALYLTADPAKAEESEKLVATEVWEDEPFERTEIKKVIEERRVPQVKTLYPYTGHGLEVKKGEVMFLLDKTNSDWWNIRKANGDNGYVPANYVKEVEPKIVSVEVKKPVTVKDVRKVKKTQYIKQKAPSAGQKQGKDIIQERQAAIQDGYALLNKLSAERQEILQNSLQLFDFYSECDDFNKWMREKSKAISTDETDMLKATKAFEKFLTDFSANKKRLEKIDAAADELAVIFPERKKEVAARQKETHKIYDSLVKLQEAQEKNLEGSASVIFFQKSCEDVCDWITEKSEKLELEEFHHDLTTVKALQRKHKGLERELAPIKDKVGQVSQLGADVIGNFPAERENIGERLADVQSRWEMLENKAAERSRRLEDAVGMQLFTSGVRTLQQWVEDTKAALNANDATVRDVQTAEDLLNKHAEVGDEIRAKQDEFNSLVSLGQKMYARQPGQETEEKVNQLGEDRKAVLRGWQEKGDYLRQVRDLQLFNREADQVDASTSAQNKFLQNIDVGDNFEDVEAMLKRHEDFSATLAAQEERVSGLVEMADSLVTAQHFSANTIGERKAKVLAGREALKAASGEKRAMLEEAKLYQDFRTQVNDLKDFVADKRRLVREDSFRDGIGKVKAQAKKHEVMEGEIKANSGQLKVLMRTGQQMIQRNHFKAKDIAAELEEMNQLWDNLVALVKEQGSKLGQAEAQNDYNRVTADLRTKLGDIQNMITTEDTGDDMRGCKKLVSQHTAAEAELAAVEQKVADLSAVASDLAEGHFDGASILSNCAEMRGAVANMKDPAEARKEALMQSMKFHEFNFDLAREMEWLAEKRTIVTAPVEVASLQQAQSLGKKHRKLEEEVQHHQVVIDKVIESGSKLLEDPKYGKEVVANTATLTESWAGLLAAAKEKGTVLASLLKAQEYFFEVAEVESWIGDKNQALNGSDFGKDEDSSVKLLTKHKALELEIDTYSGIIQEMTGTANKLVSSQHPESKLIKTRAEGLGREMKNLQQKAKARRDRLVMAIQLHEYMRESGEFLAWVRLQLGTARSVDTGRDYEHWELLLARFQEFKLRVQAGEDKFSVCDSLAKRLESAHNAQEVSSVQTQLTQEWRDLINEIEQQDRALEAAGEIHRFNRDIAEALSRIQEKGAILETEDTGKDTKSAQSHIRRHEGFENDLVALEAQLQVLIDDSAALQARYPGERAEKMLAAQEQVLASWGELQERAGQRKASLLSSSDYHTFTGMVRDLLAWSSGLRRSLITEEKVSDAASAQMLKTEHDNLKAEIETREKTFSEVVALGEAMVAEGHSAEGEVKGKIEAVLTERQKLHTAWQHKKVYLDQLIDVHFYLRDVKQILATSTAQEIALSNTECGSTIEEVEAHLKAHDAFQNLVSQQEEKVASLREHADKLIRQKHFDKDTIQAKLEEVAEKRAAVGKLCSHKTNFLNLNFLYAKFIQDANEEMTWMEEKKRKLLSENKTESSNPDNLTEKIKLLQKHQALQAEIERHKPQITEVCTKGNRLVTKNHENSPEIKASLNNLVRTWESLQHESNLISRGLEEARGILDFNNEVSKVEAWIRDKELLVSQGDLGKDYEHCMELQRKLEDAGSGATRGVDDERIEQIFQMAAKLCSEAGSEAPAVEAKRAEIGSKYSALQQDIQAYRSRLAVAGAMHAFQRDTDDTLARIKEKILQLDSSDRGKDLKDVQELTKKTEGVAEFLAGTEKRIAEHQSVSADLSRRYPDMSSEVEGKMAAMADTWTEANTRVQQRREALMSGLQFHQFVHDCQEYQTWLLDLDKRIKSVAAPNSVAEAAAFMSLHQERKAELNGRNGEALQAVGSTLVTGGHGEAASIGEHIERTVEMRDNVSQSWEATEQQLLQGHQLFIFKQANLRTVAWIEEKEAFLNNDDLGDSIAAVEALVRKHDGFIKTMEKQAVIIDELDKKGEELINNDHFDAGKIKEMVEAARARMEAVQDKCVQRLRKLEDSRHLYQFLRKVYDIKSWVKEKTQVALDESYYDLSNLQNKIQKHAGFEAEIAANKSRLLAINTEGEQLCAVGHFASQEIAGQLEDLASEWNHLQDTSKLKRERLHEANSALIYLHGLDEFETWLEDNERLLESEDHGKDLNSVSKLLKKLQATEADILSRRETLRGLEEQYEKFQASHHFMLEELDQRLSGILQRYEALHEPVQIRRENLEDSLLLHQFNREVADETIWLEEKLPQASSAHLGASLAEVQNLQQKHLLLESEILSHDKVVSQLVTKADQMVRSTHFAAEDIKMTIGNLSEGYTTLRDISSLRKLRLGDAVESQQFYFRVKEAKDWIQEKEPVLKVRDIANDEDSVQIYLKKVNDLISDLNTFEQKLNELRISAESMTERGHFDSNTIQERMHELSTYFERFRGEMAAQKQRLVDQKAVIEFIHETEEVNEWINTQMTVAASEDYGKDVSHVEMLIKNFDSFLQTINSSEERITRISELGEKLLREENSHRETILRKTSDITQLWEDLKELATARHEALSGAKQVHVFDKNADETISWIGEKEAEISADELGQDLETIQSLLERQEGFQRDLAAIQQQVAAVEKEAGVLSELFPDAAAHIEAKREDTRLAVVTLQQLSGQREEKLKQNQQIQRYFDDYRELMAWASEVIAKITSPDLASDLTGAETLIARHKELKSELDARQDSFRKFETAGKELITAGHFMATEILEKISVLNSRWEKMQECWGLREEIYNQHLDFLQWSKETDAVESWMASREPSILDSNLGSNIQEVEELIKRQQDFEGAIVAKEGDLTAVHRITMIEQNFVALREREEASRQEEVVRKEQERLDGIKKKELARITNERRRENERRRTQEIKFNREDFEQMRATQTNGRAQGPSGSVSPAVGGEEEPAFSRRGESMRVDPKKHKRTPSFTTRRRTQSFRRHTKNLNTIENLPPVEVDGFLDRKQELQSGGKRATIRSWKSYYTVLCGQLMCFFRDQEDFFESKASSSPIMIYQASVELANDYTKRNFVFRLHAPDGSEYLFGADSEEQQEEWVKKIKFHAGLPPSQQLTSYKTFDETTEQPGDPQSEPLYANIPAHGPNPATNGHGQVGPHSPPLPETMPPPALGVRGAQEVLKGRHSLTQPGSRETISGPPDSQALYANVGQVPRGGDRSSTLPVGHRASVGSADTGDSLDSVSQHSSKEKKGSVLGRFLGRKKVNP